MVNMPLVLLHLQPSACISHLQTPRKTRLPHHPAHHRPIHCRSSDRKSTSERRTTSERHKTSGGSGGRAANRVRRPAEPPSPGAHQVPPPAAGRNKTKKLVKGVAADDTAQYSVQALSSQDTWWTCMLVFRVLLITLTLGYGGIGLLWELQGLDVQHLTAWDKASAAVVVEMIQLLLVWVLIARAAEDKGTTAYGGLLQFNWSLDAVSQGGAGAAGAFALNAGLTIAAAVVVALITGVGDGGGGGGGAVEAVQGVVAVRHVSNAHDAEIAAIVASSNTAAATGMLVASGLLAPVLEELVYRGVLLPSLLPRMPTPAAVGVSAVVFAASHASLARFLPLLCLGMVLGVLRVRAEGGNLVPCIVAHAVHNLVVLTAMMLSTAPW